MAHVLKVNVNHDKKDYPKGSKCPPELQEIFAKKGFLEGSAGAEQVELSPPVDVAVGDPGTVQGASDPAPADIQAPAPKPPVGASRHVSQPSKRVG